MGLKCHLERPTRTPCRKDVYFAAICTNFNEDRLMLSAVKCGYLRRFLWAGAPNDSGVVDDGNLWRFRWLLLRKLQR